VGLSIQASSRAGLDRKQLRASEERILQTCSEKEYAPETRKPARSADNEEKTNMPTITCARCGKAAEAMTDPPMGGQLGQTIQNRVCSVCYNDWVNQQVLFINHYGLQMADPDDRKKLIQVMKEFLGLEPA
jgi:Fe-S cluster biosynthesis and repair protein YggX